MPERPRLLFLSQTLPYPPVDGVTLRTYHTMRILSQAFRVEAVCFRRRKAALHRHEGEDPAEGLRDVASVRTFPIPQQHSRARFVRDHFRSVLSRRVYTYSIYDSAEVVDHVARLTSESNDRFDLFHLDTLDLSRYLELLDPRRTVCVHHNAESELLERRARREDNALRALYLRHQARLMAREERRWCGRLAANVAVSEQDREILESRAPGGRYWVFPNGVDVEEYTPAQDAEEEDRIAFVGGTTWFPNLDALRFFAGSILPALRRAGCDAPVDWVGHATSDQVDRLSGDGLTLTGFVPDIRPFVRRAKCYVVPLRVGGGTRLKILHAWAMGKAVVSTSKGSEGLRAVDGENILVRDGPQEFADAVREVLADPALRRRLGAAGRETAERHYSWDVIGERMIRRYLDLEVLSG